MEITRKNFKESLPLVEDSINKADFLVIDTEFTGLSKGRDVSIFDTPQEYYLTLLNGSSEFLLIQFGLCAFVWDEDKQHYMNEAYNFYLFPRGRPGPEKIFLCQSSSLDFLAAQGFDFNKLIREGISYMTEPMETKLRENLTERQKSYSVEKDVITIPEENKSQIDTICQNIRKFIDKKEEDSMEIDRCNAFIRRLVFQEVRLRFKDEVFVESIVLENKNRVLKVSRITSSADVKDKDNLKKEKEWEEFEEAVGFSKVARMISQSEKLVIGHNMVLDVLHTLNHFFQPLPSDYPTFKEFAHCMFPRLLDTKYMSSLPPFKDKVNSSVLPHLLLTLSEPPFSLPVADCVDGRGYKQKDEKAHEAGYDAYITGLCFLAMHAHLARGSRVADAAVRPYLNKLYLARTAHQDSPYINLAGPDPSPSRDHVFHLTFPKEWQRNDLNQLFSAYGQITVQFLDDTSALVALSRRDLAKSVARAFAHNKRVQLQPYYIYKGHNKMASQERREDSWVGRDKLVSRTPEQVARTTPAKSTNGTPTTPEVKRPRSNSSGAVPTRKRTSSGVFQVEESEPPPKRTEAARSRSEEGRKTPEEVNGRKEVPAKSEKEVAKREKKISKSEMEIAKSIEKKAIEVFEASNTQCVAAFQESDSWD
ncbi:poly(A)-specific ribonuclease PARN-like isoform X2 [Aricia agestis]|uniref:poly(A)-specific ribonuclease PARN-like isoform X2 n=1 Tax=Aricia agestis TaxID=91739 RepID=UPI001C20BF8D|nr:poly(A)-specific ribonuclease PARN-like isoform X2 [Aricia agestis]